MPEGGGKQRYRKKKHSSIKNLNTTAVKRGSPGIMITCETGKERKCQREVIELLLHYQQKRDEEGVEEEEKLSSKKESLEDEIANLKKNNNESKCPFGIYESGCRGVLILLQKEIDSEKTCENEKTLKEHTKEEEEEGVEEEGTPRKKQKIDKKQTEAFDPVTLIQKIQQDIISNNKETPSSRFIIRMIPLQMTCFANHDNILDATKKIFANNITIAQQETTFQVKFHKRINSNINRNTLIASVADYLIETYNWKVNLSNPTITIWIEICKTTCGITILKDFKQFHNFNLSILRDEYNDTNYNDDDHDHDNVEE